jgi:hypothetical protein
MLWQEAVDFRSKRTLSAGQAVGQSRALHSIKLLQKIIKMSLEATILKEVA